MTTMITAIWAVAFLAPLAVALAAGGAERAGRTRLSVAAVRWSQLALLPALVLVLLPQGEPLALHVPWLMLGTHLQIDVVARSLLLVAVVLYGAALWSLTWEQTERPGTLTAFLLVCFVGNIGVYVAGDAVSFYLAFALMSFAAYGLVVHHRTDSARRAGRVYLVMTVLSESAILAGLILVAAAGGARVGDAAAAVAGSSYLHVIVVLLLIGFGVKAGLFPLHVWLPLAHPAAPPAASAVLSGAMVKAGLVGWFRFLPLGAVELDTIGTAVVVLAFVGAFAAVPIGVGQLDAKAVLAYSTVSQLGFLGVLVGVALAAPELAPACITAGIIYAVHHGLAKGALFLGVPVWKHHGYGPRRALALAGLVIAGLAVVGAPLSSGAVGKYASKRVVEGSVLFGVDLVHVLPLIATGSTVLLLRFAHRLVTAAAEPIDTARDPELWAWLLLVVTSATLPWVLTEQWVPLYAVPDLDPVTVWAATWPILLGVGLAGLWRYSPRRGGAPRDRWAARGAVTEPLVPAGDLIVVAERITAGLGRSVRSGGGRVAAVRDRALGVSGRVGSRVRRGLDTAAAAEDGLGGGAAAGVAVLVLLVLAVVLVLAPTLASALTPAGWPPW